MPLMREELANWVIGHERPIVGARQSSVAPGRGVPDAKNYQGVRFASAPRGEPRRFASSQIRQTVRNASRRRDDFRRADPRLGPAPNSPARFRRLQTVRRLGIHP